MKYFYFILLALLVTFLFIFTNLNPEIIALDLFFIKIEGISIGFSIVFSAYDGVVVNVFEIMKV